MAELGMAFLNPIAKQQEMEQSAALAPVTLAHQAALARESQARASKLETEAVGEKAAATMMAERLSGFGSDGTPTGKPPSISDLLLSQAHIYAASGLPAKATLALQGAATVAAHEATAENQKFMRDQRDLTAKAQLATRLGNMLRGVTDQESWDRANQTFQAAFGKPSPYAAYAYDPTLVASLKSNALGLKEQAELDFKKAQEARRVKDVDSKTAHRLVQEETARADLKLKQDREARLAKVGGKDVGSPNSQEIKAATRLLEAQPGLVDSKDMDTAAFDVAAQARALRKSNQGMTSDEAIRKSIATKRAAGDFTPGSPSNFLGMGGTKANYQVAETLPASGKKSDLVVGKNYKNGAGMVQQWTAQGWKPVGPAATPTKAAPAQATLPDDDEDEMP